MKKLVSESEYARLLNITNKTAERRRLLGVIQPKVVKYGKINRYYYEVEDKVSNIVDK